MDFENFVIDLFDKVDANHSREDFKEGLNRFTINRNLLDGSGIIEDGKSIYATELEEEFGITDLHLFVTSNVLELRFYYDKAYIIGDTLKNRVKEWIRYAEASMNLENRVIKVLDSNAYMTKRLFRDIWWMTTRDLTTGDVGADWDMFEETYEYIVTGK